MCQKKQFLNKIKTVLFFIALSINMISCEDFFTDNNPADRRDLIVDSWTCTEKSTLSGKSAYTVDISKDLSDSSKVVLDNFYNLGLGKNIRAQYSNNSLTIKNQRIDDFTINGSGSVRQNNTVIDLSFYVAYPGGETDTVTATLTRM